MPRCIFCAIAAGEEPASRVWEDDVCCAFMDVAPISPGHVLVIPRRHARLIHELPQDVRRHLFDVGCRVRRAIGASSVAADGVNLMLNDGRAANQTVPHVHLHVVPRRRGDTWRIALGFVARMFGLGGRAGNRRALDEMAAEIGSHLGRAEDG